ncbi:MAG: enoyl-CoA hydratase/isomerase family protein [Caulobacteraceae bacterium]
MPETEPPVLARIEGRVGRITLNRPKALHALTLEMIRLLTRALLDWRKNDGVELIILDHTGERGFCAGGDIKSAVTGGPSREFFFEEYQLNEFMFGYPKPMAVILDGICMGGGVGLAMPCRYRVATEKTLFAMPETAIGLFPDVGGGWWLPRLPGESGMWLALTGARIKSADCLLLGIATDFVKSNDVEAIKREILAAPEMIEEILTRYEADAGEPPIAEHRDAIDRTFARDSVEAVFAALDDGAEWTKTQLDILKTRSPTAMKVAFRQLREGRERRSFAEEMVVETRIGSRVSYSHDFAEGVRAVLVDRDNRPQWAPNTLEGVDQAALDAIFAPLSAEEEWTPLV